MTVDYTQPPQQQSTPPQPGQPPAQKSSGCLKVFLIGCGVLIFLGAAFAAALVFIVFGAIKRSDVYREALNRVRADQRVVAAIGEPIDPGFWVSGSVHVLTILGLPLAVCCMATITRLAPVTRSIAPPMPGTILPGIIQLASRPCAST